MLGEFNSRNGESLRTLIDKHGVQLRHFPDDVMTALAKASETVLAELEGADDLTSRTYKSFKAFRAQAIGWSKLADQGFLDMRERLIKG
jgi:TRAP-type mannitol/chloroaromatic compound transport system substrate-binding protein